MLIALSGCGGGCAGCGIEPIPGGFPAAKRNPNAGQLRVTPTALQKIAADPAGIIGPLAGSSTTPGIITFPIPATCSGTPTICCPGGTPSNNCGPVQINLNKMANDSDRLVLTAANGIAAPNGRLDVTLRARVKTQSDLIISISGTDCKVHIDTTAGSTPDLTLTSQVALSQDTPGAGTTRIVAGSTSVSLESNDYSITPVSPLADALCYGATFIPKSVIEGQLASMVEGQINDATCKACPSGNVAECGSSFATACTGGVCQEGNKCLQEIGLDGRMRGSSLFASLSPGTTGAIDLYEVAGGYSLSNNNGLSLGLLGGMEPAGAPRDLCGPMSAAPAVVSIPQSAIFQNNTFNAQAFDVGIGLHKSQLAQFAYAGYNGGLLCLTLGSSTVAQLSTDTISLLSRSLGKLVEENSPMSVGIRPQSPPTITLGKNTFKDDGMGNMVLDEPLLDIRFSALEIDFFASIDDQYNRVFTVVTDVHLPIGLQTSAMGTLTPVIGNPMDAFTNVTVKNSEAITESPAEIAGLFPTLLGLVLPQLSGGLGAISLPTLGGLALDVKAVTAVGDNGANDFLAIFANLVPAPAARVVDTSVDIVNVTEPSDALQRDVTKWATHQPPSVTLAMSGSEANLEYSYRINGGTWSAWSASKQQTLAPRVFWLPGTHKVDVRARRIGDPASIDTTPVSLDLPMGLAVPPGKGLLARPAPQSDFHGQAGASGCSCDSSHSTPSGALFALVIAAILLPMRRLRRKMARLGTTVWLAAMACLPGCSCGSAPCGDAECLPGDVAMGAIGRFTSVAADDKRVLVATYDQQLGDLVVVDATSPDKLVYKAVDGIPADVTPTHDPDTYRGGIEDPGPNVGAYTSIALIGGTGRVAYQDRDEHTLKYAYETKSGGSWKSYAVDEGDALTGYFSSIAMDGDGKPAIAYMAIGIDDGMFHRTTELRLVRASSANPTSAGDWSSALIASAPGSCGGICGSGEVCVVGADATEPQSCVVPTTDCTSMCADTEACVMGACIERVDAPKILQPPLGTGLYVSLVTLADGRLAAAYYDGTRRALILAVESGKGTSMFAETVLDGDAVGADRGMWSSAVVGSDGNTIHIAYQDALGDQLMYTSWNGTPGTPAVVDDGQRQGDRTHPVGAAASIYMNGGEPAIAYQDGLKSDVYVATRAGSTWTTNGVAVGPLLDGFSIGATSGHGTPVLAWGSMDPALSPPTTLVVRSP